jgi:hypothetical protein
MKKILRILAFFLLCLPLRAATYYIDFSGSDANNGTSKGTPWKRAPGMSGFSAAYTHTAGDQFIFKGGVTWDNTIAPWNNANSGASGSPDYYGVDKTWYSGASWTNPIFDGGSKSSGLTSPYFYFTGSYVTLDSLQIQNIGVAGVNQGNYVIEMRSDHDLLVENMVMPVESRIAFYHLNTSGGELDNITFVNNDISQCSWGIAVATASANSITNHIIIHDNKIHDMHDQMANGVHGDGVIIFNGGSDPTQYLENIQFYNNSFYGDFSLSDASAAGMTALFFCEECNGSVLIYNNYGYDTATASGYVFDGGPTIGAAPASNVYLYNNSFQMTPDWLGFAILSSFTSVTTANNVYKGGATAYTIGYYGVVGNFVADYDDLYGYTSQVASVGISTNRILYNWAAFQAAGYEAHGLNVNPRFISSTNLQLSGGPPASPAIGTGYNLSAVFTTDAIGNTWVPPWSMGAYAPEPAASLSTSLFAFSPPSYGTGVTSAAQTVTVTNAGNLNLTFTTATLSGTNSADFSISADTCVIGGVGQTIAPLGTCTVSVTFTPSIVGAETATLSLASNDPLSPATVSLSGTGASGAVPGLSTSSLTWAGQVVGTTQSVTLTNTGNTTLTISSITISGSQFVFTGSNTCGSTLSRLAACTITVAPTVNGNPATTSFTVAGNGTPATVSATLAASGIVPGAATTVGGTAGIQ